MIRFAPVKNLLRSAKLKVAIWESKIIKLVALKPNKCEMLNIRFVNIIGGATVLLLSLLLNNMLMTLYSLL